MQTQRPVHYALLSVSDTDGIVEFAQSLVQHGVQIMATDGTAATLRNHGIKILSITDYTHSPEMMDGRVKTLHPKVHGGLLGRPGIDDGVMEQHGIHAIDLLVVNLYPFGATITKPDCTFAEAVENIDIGGPAMIRSAAKNHQHVTVITDPLDYHRVASEMEKNNGCTSAELRRMLAQKAFAYTAAYDRMIADYLLQHSQPETDPFPEYYSPVFKRESTLRYGENPHQRAAYYTMVHPQKPESLSTLCLQGKALSYNNLIDIDCALQLLTRLNSLIPACVIVKHATPCGVAQAMHPPDAYEHAYRCDPESAFGGVVAVNFEINVPIIVNMLHSRFIEVLIAPSITAAAKAILEQKPDLRVIVYDEHAYKKQPTMVHRSLQNGLLLQEPDISPDYCCPITCVTDRKPSGVQQDNLFFAWNVAACVHSNAIVFVKDYATIGIGAGQTSRIFAAKIAVLRAEMAGLSLAGSVMASDGFLPFADSIEFAAQHGIAAIIQPGGSKRDSEVIAAANAAGISMVFTGIRHFKH